MVSYSILHEYPKFGKTDLGKMLYKNITKADKTVIDIEHFGWNKYKEITNNTFNINPKILFNNKTFDSYKIDTVNDIKAYKVPI